MPDQPTPDVPDDLLDLAWRAELRRRAPRADDALIEEYCDPEKLSVKGQREELRSILAAVLPEHARQVRAQLTAGQGQEPDSLTVYPANEKLYGRCDTCGEVRWHTEYNRAGCESERSEHCGCCVHPHDLGRGWHENWKPGVAHTCVLCPDSPKSARREGQ